MVCGLHHRPVPLAHDLEIRVPRRTGTRQSASRWSSGGDGCRGEQHQGTLFSAGDRRARLPSLVGTHIYYEDGRNCVWPIRPSRRRSGRAREDSPRWTICNAARSSPEQFARGNSVAQWVCERLGIHGSLPHIDECRVASQSPVAMSSVAGTPELGARARE